MEHITIFRRKGQVGDIRLRFRLLRLSDAGEGRKGTLKG